MTTTAIITRQSAKVAPPFRWRDQEGNKWLPADMETRHLFYTLRMIWNHAMPPEAQTHDYNTYRFSSFYTGEYMKNAVRAIVAELHTRDDMRQDWIEQYEHMRQWCQQLRLTDEQEPNQ